MRSSVSREDAWGKPGTGSTGACRTCMAIHAPGPRLLVSSPALRRRPRRRWLPGGTLSVVPLVDLMLVLVLYLLPQFTTSGETTCLCDFDVPDATNTASLERAPIVAIVGDHVTLGVGGTGRRVDGPGREDLQALTDDLLTLRRNWSLIHPAETPSPSWVLQADRRTDFRLVRAVFAACAKAGYTNGQLLVRKQVPSWTL